MSPLDVVVVAARVGRTEEHHLRSVMKVFVVGVLDLKVSGGPFRRRKGYLEALGGN